MAQVSDRPVVAAPSRTVTERKIERTHRIRTRWRPGLALLDSAAVSALAAAVFAVHGYDGVLTSDLGVFTYGGEQVARGVPPYVGIFNSVGPLADAVPGAAIWAGQLVGIGPVFAARGAFTLLSALCCGLLYLLARDVYGSRLAGFVAPAVFVTFPRFSQLASDGPREKTTMVLLLLAALILLGRCHWGAAGAATALATLTWQPSVVVPVAAVAVLVVIDRRRWPAGLRFLAGGALTAGATAAAFWLAGALAPAVRGFVLVNVFYTHQPSAFSDPVTTLRMLWQAYGISLPVGMVGLSASVVAGFFARPLTRRCRRFSAPVPWRLVAVAAGAAAGTGWTLAVINGAQDPFVLLPFASLGVAGLVILAVESLTRRGALAVGAVVVAGCTALAGWQSVTSRDDALLQQRADVDAVLDTEPSNATLMSIGVPQMTALADRPDVSTYQLFGPRMLGFLTATLPGGLAGYEQRISRLRPTFVAVSPRSCESRWARPMLRAHYASVGEGPGWTWFVRRSVGTGSVLAARAANGSAMGHPRRAQGLRA